ILRIRESRATKRAARGLERLARYFSKRGVKVTADQITSVCASEREFPPLPEGLATRVLAGVEAGLGKRPSNRLTRRTLLTIYWAPWWRRLKSAGICLLVFGVVSALGAWWVSSLWRSGRLVAWFIESSTLRHARSVPELAEPARPWPGDPLQPAISAEQARSPGEFFHVTNIWRAHLKFSEGQWKRLEPRRIDPVPKLFQGDGTIVLRN